MNSCHLNFLGALKVRFEKMLSAITVDIQLGETLLTMKVVVVIYDLCLLLTCWNFSSCQICALSKQECKEALLAI